MVSANLANMKKGRPPSDESKTNSSIELLVSQSEAAERLNVSRESVKRAQTVISHALPEIRDMVVSVELSVSAAAAVAELPMEKQREAVNGGVAGVKTAAREASQPPPASLAEERESIDGQWLLPILRI